MIRGKPSLIGIAGETHITFLMPSGDSAATRLGSFCLEDFLAEGEDTLLPKKARHAINRLLVVPDYWIGNSFHEFQARKPSVITAFIERKLKLDQPSLSEVGEFYDYAVVQDQDRRRLLCATYLQETVVYRLHRRLTSLGIRPRRITTPALIWQAKLADRIADFAGQGTGFVHLTAEDCFLYFYFQGQFLFSRHIQLPQAGENASQVYAQLNYEINQSFYLYSQKTKSAVDALYLLAADPTAGRQLADLLGKPIRELTFSPSPPVVADDTGDFDAMGGFALPDLVGHGHPAITYKPLRIELTWRPVQWAGMVVGMLLALVLAVECGYLHVRSSAVGREMARLQASVAEPPELLLGELSQNLSDVTMALARPSGSGTVMRTLLALPPEVSLRSIVLDAADTHTLKIDAIIDADHPEAFKAILDAFLNRINDRFGLAERPLREKDVTIQLERREGNEHKPLYLIHVGFEIT